MLSSAPLALLALAAPALATIYTTNPVQATKHTGGTVLKIEWNDDGMAPALSTIGVCSVDLCVGSTTQQTCIQNLAESVDVSKASSVEAVIDPSVGTDGDFYFIRYTAENYTELNQNYLQFSARFTLDGMNGTFTPQVQSQIDAGMSSSLPSASGSATASASATASTTSSAAPKSSAASSAASSVSKAPTASITPPPATSSSGAGAVVAPLALALVAGMAGVIAM